MNICYLCSQDLTKVESRHESFATNQGEQIELHVLVVNFLHFNSSIKHCKAT
jgi:hypothetical protein